MATTAEAATQAKPIIFTLPGRVVDTRLQVFDKEFHVHSAILTLYSAFFRKFLDSADKTVATGLQFQYDYKTCLDADGTWGLEASSKVSIRCSSSYRMLSALWLRLF